MLRITTLLAAGAIAVGGLVVAGPAAQASPAPVARVTPTEFALAAFGVGTAVRGGEVPASSGRTAYRIIGCTNRAGVERENHIAEATVPGLGDVSAVKTRIWTSKRDGVVGSNSVHTIGKLVIGRGSDQGTLTISAIESRARAFHDNAGFHAAHESSVGKIVYRPVDGSPEVYAAPNPGETLEIPGLARLTFGGTKAREDAEGARAATTALRIDVLPSSTVARVAHVSAKIGDGVKHGIFRGSANATRASGLDGNVTSGPNPHLPMPCQGTDGDVRSNNLAELNLDNQVVASALNTSLMGDQTHKRAWGWARSSIARVELGEGRLVLSGIVGEAAVERAGSQITRSLEGTGVDAITYDGEPQDVPEPGEALIIPGVAMIETKLSEDTDGGVKVTAVRVTLLDGSGAVIELGQAELSIKRSGL